MLQFKIKSTGGRATGPLWLLPMLLLLATLGGCEGEAGGDKYEWVTINDQKFKLELAITEDQIQTGLMNRASLGENEGMLFIFGEARPRRFWMKNCLIPIDVIYLDPQGRVVSMLEMKPPAKGTPDDEQIYYPSQYPAQFAIELNGGMARKLKVEMGQKIPLDLRGLKARAVVVD